MPDHVILKMVAQAESERHAHEEAEPQEQQTQRFPQMELEEGPLLSEQV